MFVKREGCADCGLFAIAYATEYCYGNYSECYRYMYLHVNYDIVM